MARKYLNNYTTLLTAAITDTATTMTVGTAPAALAGGDYYRLQISLRNAQGVLTKQEFVDVTAITGNDLTITRAAEGSTALSWDTGTRVELVETAASFDLAGGATSLGSLDDVTLATVADGEVLAYNATSMQWENTAVGGTGTVTSVGMTAPTGLTVSGSPITSSGTLAIALESGYSIPTDAQQAAWLERSGDTITDVTITRYTETIAVATTTIDRADGGLQTLTLTADSALTWALNNGEKIQLYLTPAGFNVTNWGVTHWMTDVPTLATENMIVVEKVGGNIYAWDGGSR